MLSDEQRKFVEGVHVLPPRAGDESHLAPPGMSSNTRPRSFPVSPLSNSPLGTIYGTSQVPSQQDLGWPQTLEDESEWAFAPQAMMEQPNQVVDRTPFGMLSPNVSMNTYPYSNGHHNSPMQNTTFFHGYPSPISPFYDSEDRSLHYPNGLPASSHHIASTQRFDGPGNQYYSPYDPAMGQNYSGYEELAMEMNSSPRVEQQSHLDSDQASQPDDTPYAQLIYQALMSVEDHRMILKDIYKWIAENTDKAADPDFTGWQNSVRHNLSMNHAFNKLPYTNPLDKSKKGFIWALDKSAITNGIQPTTRYRAKKDDNQNTPPSSSSKPPKGGRVQDLLRQRSGRRGGQTTGRRAATREVLHRRESPHHSHSHSHHRRHHKHHHRQQQQEQQRYSSTSTTSAAASPSYAASPPSSSSLPFPSSDFISPPSRSHSRFYAPGPLSSFDESERGDLLPYTNTTGLPELWIRPRGMVMAAAGGGSGTATPSSSGFRTSEEDEVEDDDGDGFEFDRGIPFCNRGGVPVSNSSSGSLVLPTTTTTTTGAVGSPFMTRVPAAGVSGAEFGDVELAAGYLADAEEGSSALLEGQVDLEGEEVGGWGHGEGMEFQQAFDMGGEDAGGFLG